MRLKFALLFPVALLACDERPRLASFAGNACEPATVIASLPDNVREASGLAISRRHANLLWIHDDGPANELIAIDTAGRERGRVRVDADITDWEDLATADCGDDTCLFIADIGNNLRARETGVIYRVPEPDPDTRATAHADAFPFRYPDGAHDAEALFVLPGQHAFIVTKGRSGPVTVYRYPGPLRNETVTLQRVQSLSPGIVQFPDMVTAAAATTDGRTVAIRTYTWLQLYQPAGDSLRPLHAGRADLTPLREPQGEAMDIRADGTIFLASERGLSRTRPPLSRLKCDI